MRHHALSYLKHRAVARKWHPTWQEQGRAPGMGEPSAEADHELEARELCDAFRETVDQLPQRYAEIAEVMGTSVRTDKTQLVRADKALRQRLAPWM